MFVSKGSLQSSLSLISMSERLRGSWGKMIRHLQGRIPFFSGKKSISWWLKYFVSQRGWHLRRRWNGEKGDNNENPFRHAFVPFLYFLLIDSVPLFPSKIFSSLCLSSFAPNPRSLLLSLLFFSAPTAEVERIHLKCICLKKQFKVELIQVLEVLAWKIVSKLKVWTNVKRKNFQLFFSLLFGGGNSSRM